MSDKQENPTNTSGRVIPSAILYLTVSLIAAPIVLYLELGLWSLLPYFSITIGILSIMALAGKLYVVQSLLVGLHKQHLTTSEKLARVLGEMEETQNVCTEELMSLVRLQTNLLKKSMKTKDPTGQSIQAPSSKFIN